jgi:hypothetical protein
MERKMVGRIEFTTQTALALWDCEILGQLSDGAWENTRPHEHWKFWHALDSAVGSENKVTVDKGTYSPYCVKNRYNIACLYEYVVDRMLAHGRMASVTGDKKLWQIADDMPATLAEFLKCKETGDWQRAWHAKELNAVEIPVAVDFYMSKYGMKELRRDVKVIKEAMKTARTYRY